MLKLLRRIAGDDIEASAGKLDGLIKRHEAYGEAIRALLVCLQDVAMDICEIDAAAYRDAINRFRASFFEHKSAKRIHACLDREKKAIARYIERQREYIEERDHELRKIIDLLSRAMADLNSANNAYHQQILQQGEKIEPITRLDDIRKIKSALEKEVESLRQTVQAKQTDEQTRIESLSSQLEILQKSCCPPKRNPCVTDLPGSTTDAL